MIYLNGTPINVTLFPDNTSQVWKLSQLEIPDTNWVHIKWEFTHEGEFLQIAQLKHLLDNLGFTSTLRIKYLPYGRQDKKISNQTTFALHSFSKLLNSLNFNEVIIHDPHSEAALMMIDNSKAWYPVEIVNQVFEITNSDFLCYPDKGAWMKYGNLKNPIYFQNFIYGEKVRNQSTGEIISYKLVNLSHYNIKDKNILIVDDICDGGATFKILADKLFEAGAKEVNLFVTNGIFSKGLKILEDSGINNIYTQYGKVSEVQGFLTYKELK